MAKNHHIMSPATQQMQLFDVSHSTPQFGDRIRSVSIKGEMFFSVLDIFKNYSAAQNAAQSWKGTEAFLIKQGAISKDWAKSSDIESISLRMHKFDGERQRSTPVATFKMIMRIGQVTTFKEWEPMRDWMAGLAQERIEEDVNPELGVLRAQERFLESKQAQGMSANEAKDFLVLVQEGHVSRRQWTDVLRDVVRGVIQYGVITDAQYVILFGMKAKRITEETGFKTARDGMTLVGRQIVNACDITLVSEFKRHTDLTFPQAVELAKGVCSDFSPTIKLLEARMGVSLATGHKLLR